MVKILMRWRHSRERSLEDDMHALDHRRDTFIHGLIHNRKGEDIERFELWLSKERRRLVRVNEMRCEECWRRALTARDDQGRTPLHWASSGVEARHERLAGGCAFRTRYKATCSVYK